MSYPDTYTARAHNASQGVDDDEAELAWIDKALLKLFSAADDLRGSEAANVLLRDACQQAGREIEAMAARIKEMMP
jgi:hypothetical protein